MDIHNIDRAAAFTTKDGSEIRELLAHRNSCIRNQSLAEARLPAGRATMPHLHPQAEEIYYIIEGQGEMILAHEKRTVVPGDAIAIPPGLPHQIINEASVPVNDAYIPLDGKLVLETSDYIVATAGANSTLKILVSVLETANA